MSKIRLYGATSGYTELVPNSISGDNTITLPTTVGEVVIKDPNGNINVNSINNGPLAGFRNAIINGNFDIWQRGVTIDTGSSAGAYAADRWFVRGNNTIVSKQSGTIEGEPESFLRASWANNTLSISSIVQSIEGVRTFSGETVTLSFWAKTIGTQFNTQVVLTQYPGSSGSGGVILFLSLATPITTSWQKYTFTVTLPSMAGKTISGGDDHLALSFNCPIFFNGSMDLAKVQLEPGPFATQFESRPIGIEELLCYRYYFSISDTTEANAFLNIGSNGTIYSSAAGSYGCSSSTYPAPMRIVPTFSLLPGASYTYSGTATGVGLQPYKTHIRSYITTSGAGNAFATHTGGGFELNAEIT